MKPQQLYDLYASHNKLNQGNSEYTSWHFCDNEKDANELAELVLSGTKTATSSLHVLYELEQEPLPKIGELSIIENWDGDAICIIQTINVYLSSYKEVTKSHAYREGEGDRSLSYWKDVHEACYRRYLEEVHLPFTEDLLVVCEEFEVIYK